MEAGYPGWMRVLVAGWPSFLHGEATAGDVLSMRRVTDALASAGVEHDTVWSPGFRPGALRLEDAQPARYSHVVFACGPAHGWQVRELHERFARSRRIAVGVSVLDPDDPAVRGFHAVFPRDSEIPDGPAPRADLALAAHTAAVPVVGVVLAPGQAEYGDRRRHREVHEAVTTWLLGLDCARLPLDTRLDTTDWRHCATADQFTSVLTRLDALVSTRLHGLVLGLRCGVPVLAVDPVEGGGKVTAQAVALGWPALVAARDCADRDVLWRWWRWCLSPEGRARAGARSVPKDDPLIDELMTELEQEVA